MENKIEEHRTETNWAVAMHLSPFAAALIPLAGIVAPVTLWLLKRRESRYLDTQGKEVINFMICNGLVGAVLMLMALAMPFVGANTGYQPGFSVLPISIILAAIPVGVFSLVMPIVAAVKCSNGEDFRYPYIYRLVK